MTLELRDRSALNERFEELRVRKARDGTLSDNITIALLDNIKRFYRGRVKA